jgi:hypothetical protein
MHATGGEALYRIPDGSASLLAACGITGDSEWYCGIRARVA